MKNASRCPVCQGKGFVSQLFYLTHPYVESGTSSNTATQQCRSCNGRGVVFG